MKKSGRIAAAVGLVCVVGCAHDVVRKMASDIDPPLVFDESWTTDNQAQVDRIIQVNQQMLTARAVNDTRTRRDAHPKHHGCAVGNFVIDASPLPPALRVGIFAPGLKTTWPAWVRFSNGNPDGAQASDLTPDIRGMAIKLMGVTGTPTGTQDFVMLTDKEFFTADGADYEALHNALGSKWSEFVYFVIQGHGTEQERLLAGNRVYGNPLQGEYFSSVAYKLGNVSMKFKAAPCPGSTIKDPIPLLDPTKNYLSTNLINTLKAPGAQAACYQFFVEPNNQMDKQGVEDPMTIWDEGPSPYLPVATLTFPGNQTDVGSQAQMNLCENMSFNPWHTLPDTRPLGQINRMRAQIYPTMSTFRHNANHMPLGLEPQSFTPCTDTATAGLCQTPQH